MSSFSFSWPFLSTAPSHRMYCKLICTSFPFANCDELPGNHVGYCHAMHDASWYLREVTHELQQANFCVIDAKVIDHDEEEVLLALKVQGITVVIVACSCIVSRWSQQVSCIQWWWRLTRDTQVVLIDTIYEKVRLFFFPATSASQPLLDFGTRTWLQWLSLQKHRWGCHCWDFNSLHACSSPREWTLRWQNPYCSLLWDLHSFQIMPALSSFLDSIDCLLWLL